MNQEKQDTIVLFMGLDIEALQEKFKKDLTENERKIFDRVEELIKKEYISLYSELYSSFQFTSSAKLKKFVADINEDACVKTLVSIHKNEYVAAIYKGEGSLDDVKKEALSIISDLYEELEDDALVLEEVKDLRFAFTMTN